VIDYGPRSGLEAAYLLSECAVHMRSRSASLGTAPDQLRIGDSTKQGCPFFGASVSYTRRVKVAPKRDEQVFVVLPRWQGACTVIRIDGKQVGSSLWPPDEVALRTSAPRACEL